METFVEEPVSRRTDECEENSCIEYGEYKSHHGHPESAAYVVVSARVIEDNCCVTTPLGGGCMGQDGR